MQPFTPLLLSWLGKSELKTLQAAEWYDGPPGARKVFVTSW
jgi:DNA repair protein RecO (recombination protein O)